MRKQTEGTWLILREPGRVPILKGPFHCERLTATLREWMVARPSAFITVLNIIDGYPIVQDGPECLQMLDGRFAATAKRHRASTRTAFANKQPSTNSN